MYYILDLIPELKNTIGFEKKNPHHHLDVWNHTLLALSLSEKDFDIRLCLLLHDIGKPFSYQDEEVRHFHGHPEVSNKMSLEILNRLGYGEDFINLNKKLSGIVKTLPLYGRALSDDIKKRLDHS